MTITVDWGVIIPVLTTLILAILSFFYAAHSSFSNKIANLSKDVEIQNNELDSIKNMELSYMRQTIKEHSLAIAKNDEKYEKILEKISDLKLAIENKQNRV